MTRGRRTTGTTSKGSKESKGTTNKLEGFEDSVLAFMRNIQTRLDKIEDSREQERVDNLTSDGLKKRERQQSYAEQMEHVFKQYLENTVFEGPMPATMKDRQGRYVPVKENGQAVLTTNIRVWRRNQNGGLYPIKNGYLHLYPLVVRWAYDKEGAIKMLDALASQLRTPSQTASDEIDATSGPGNTL